MKLNEFNERCNDERLKTPEAQKLLSVLLSFPDDKQVDISKALIRWREEHYTEEAMAFDLARILSA